MVGIKSLSLDAKVLRLKNRWRLIGLVLLIASVAQPIFSSFMSQIPPEQLFAPMTMMNGGEPLPASVTSLFAGVFANIEFSLAFAALKLAAGLSIFFAARNLGDAQTWPTSVLKVASLFGMAAFVGIGVFFCYSAVVMSGEMSLPVFMTLSMMVMGLVTAFFPARWLWNNFQALNTI